MPSELVADLLAFLHASPTPYHAVQSAVERLEAAGFARLDERVAWDRLAAGRYYTVHGDSALFAFVLPAARAGAAGGGFRLIGAHTDSPNLRLKPHAAYAREGYAQLGVEVYGGVLLNSWLDRDLGLAGRVLVRDGSGGVGARLLRIDRPLARVPQLAIHLDREVNDSGLVLNRQEHLAPIWALAGDDGADLVGLCARQLGVAAEAIVASELMLYDLQAPTLAGLNQELIFSARLDNLAMCHAAVRALVACAESPAALVAVPLIALFDHEEIGSQSAYGAASSSLGRLLERISLARGHSRDEHLRALAASRCISADMAHAVHPNYAEKHEPHHRPRLNGGPVIKVNAQQRYATSARTAAEFAALCAAAEVPVQHYVHRTDLPCGSTIGPIASTVLGIDTVDVGAAMLSMHSARELGGAADPDLMGRVLPRFFTERLD